MSLDYELIDENQIVLKSEKKEDSFLCGIITDQLSSQVLAFANIISVDSMIGIGADENGIFKLPIDIALGKNFTASYVGYENLVFSFKDLKECKSTEEVLKNQDAYKIKMSIPEFSTPFLIIKEYITDGIDLSQNGFSTRIKPNFLGALPGQVEPDVMKTIQFLPGVTTPSSKASDIYIRGGTPDQNLILWEDIPIYHSAHYFGMISAVDPFVISEMNVYRGGFDASFGGRAASVIEMKSYGLDHKDNFVNVGSNFINSYLNGHYTFGNKIENSITYSVRRSFTEAWESPTFKTITRFNQQGLVLGDANRSNPIGNDKIKNDFDFLDTHIKFSSQFSDKTTFNISGIYASNDFIDEIIDDQEMQSQKDTMTLQNQGMSIELKQQWSPQFSSEIKAVATNYNYDYNYVVKESEVNKPRLEGVKSNQIIDKQLQFASHYFLPKNQSFNIGYQYTDYDIAFEAKEGKKGRNDIEDKGKTESFLHAAFFSFKNPIQNKLGIDAGIRMNYYEASQKLYWEPRVSLSYQLIESLSLHANYGKHHQFIGQTTTFRGSENGISTAIWRLAENKSIPIIEAEQFQLGFIFSKQNWVLDFQIYSKEIVGLSSRSYDFENTDSGNPAIGKSNSRGFDALVKKRFNKNLKVWASYTYSEIEMNFKELANKPFPSDFDQPHNLKLSGQYKINDFQISAGFYFSSGLGYTIIEDYKLINEPNEEIIFDIDYGAINAKRLNNTTEFNISGLYTLDIPSAGWKAHFSGSVTNLLNKHNVYNRSFYIDTSPMQPSRISSPLDKINLPFTYNFSIRFEL